MRLIACANGRLVIRAAAGAPVAQEHDALDRAEPHQLPRALGGPSAVAVGDRGREDPDVGDLVEGASRERALLPEELLGDVVLPQARR